MFRVQLGARLASPLRRHCCRCVHGKTMLLLWSPFVPSPIAVHAYILPRLLSCGRNTTFVLLLAVAGIGNRICFRRVDLPDTRACDFRPGIGVKGQDNPPRQPSYWALGTLRPALRCDCSPTRFGCGRQGCTIEHTNKCSALLGSFLGQFPLNTLLAVHIWHTYDTYSSTNEPGTQQPSGT